ncbi:MAG: DMT family transporter [Planctomycetes bacterium]|nr:DMT family transporter [Planctomycetota bacterium]
MLDCNLLLQIKPGELAALATAVCWTLTALCFEYSCKKTSSLSVNTIKMYLAFVLFSVFALIFRGSPFPVDASGFAWRWLCLSGIVGFVIGDLFLFKALSIIGARTSMLIMALTPLVTTVIGFFVLNEMISQKLCIGMALTISGVAIVILTRESKSKQLKHPVKGIVFACIGMVGQAVGLVLSKYGMGDYNAFSATQIRIIAGLVGFTLVMFHLKAWGQVLVAFKHGPSLKATIIGTVFGPFVGVYLSLLAIQYISTGEASTIIAIVPVLIIPFSILLFKEKVNLREIVGAVIAVSGTAIMFK